MKQHEYMLRADKDVYESQAPHYCIEVSTNNMSCYTEILDAAYRIISEYQVKEREDKPEREVTAE